MKKSHVPFVVVQATVFTAVTESHIQGLRVALDVNADGRDIVTLVNTKFLILKQKPLNFNCIAHTVFQHEH